MWWSNVQCPHCSMQDVGCLITPNGWPTETKREVHEVLHLLPQNQHWGNDLEVHMHTDKWSGCARGTHWSTRPTLCRTGCKWLASSVLGSGCMANQQLFGHKWLRLCWGRLQLTIMFRRWMKVDRQHVHNTLTIAKHCKHWNPVQICPYSVKL